MKKTLVVLTLSVLASLAVGTAASADTVIIHRHGYHHPHFFHHHHDFHSHRTVIINR